jgi:hypothetical protein
MVVLPVVDIDFYLSTPFTVFSVTYIICKGPKVDA